MANINKRKLNFAKITKMFFYMFCFVLTIEICARVDDLLTYNAPLLSKYTSFRLRTIDTDGIPVNVPSIRFEKWQNNRFGFRGPDIEEAKPDNIVRIVCMGQSESYGLYENPDMEWPAQLSSMLSGSLFEVINASVVGMGLEKCYAYLDKYVFKFNPDVIILCINPYGYAAVYERSSERNPGPAGAGKNKIVRSSLKLSDIIDNVRVFPKMKQSIKKLLPPSILHSYQLKKSVSELKQAEEKVLKGKKPKDYISETVLNKYREDVERLITQISEKGISVIILSYPALLDKNNINLYPHIHASQRFWLVEYSLNGAIDISTKIDSVMKVIAEEKQLGFVDSRFSPPHDPDHFSDGVHYTNEGARIVAENVARVILKQ